MCGIFGFTINNFYDTQKIALAMSNSIHHRGPDDKGSWIDHNNNVMLGHTRLSILDLSNAGHQPMTSKSKRYTIVFNGEIYNHLELRDVLKQGKWEGHSDTETILEGFETWGIPETIKRMIGMFAFSVWDNQTQQLYLCRDRIGEKPLYYSFQQGTFMFASELKALLKHPIFKPEIDRTALSMQLRHNYIPDPYCIYENVYKLLPGHYLTYDLNKKQSSVTPYWKLDKAINENHLLLNAQETDSEMISFLEDKIKQAVASQMISDVPLGAFLSGGIDSSLISALMQTQSVKPIKTFTIGFNQAEFNEAHYAKEIANYLGTDHTELYVTEQDALDIIPLLPTIYDEPFSDSSQIPTFIVSKMAKKNVQVALSGDGADEIFGGYNRYFWATKLWNHTENLPWTIRQAIISIGSLCPPHILNSKFEAFSHFLPKKYHYKTFGDKLFKLFDLLALNTKEDVYHMLISQWRTDSNLVIGSKEDNHFLKTFYQSPKLDFISQMMFTDTLTYLPGDILTKVDRAAMAVSLETRAPFLDHRVIEASWKLPMSMKIRGGEGKWILRQILYKYVPKKLLERPKMGFAAPIDTWLRGPLKEWAEELINENRLIHEGFLNPKPIQKKWKEHLSKERNWQYDLWSVLMFQAWLETQKSSYES